MKESIQFADRCREDLIFQKVPGSTKEEVLKNVADRLLKLGVVKESYYGALLERERDYPTGLDLGGLNIAIPHTYPQHIVKNAVVVVVPENPVAFQSMDDPDTAVTVSLILCPLLEKMDDNIKLLPSLMKFFINADTIQKILDAGSPKEILDFIRA